MKIALLGIGAMQSRMAKNLLNAGFELALYNRTESACSDLTSLGATAYSSPRLAAEQADIVISMVTNDEAARTVWLAPETGAIHGLGKHHIAVESSTLSIGCIEELAETIGSGTFFSFNSG